MLSFDEANAPKASVSHVKNSLFFYSEALVQVSAKKLV
jgi:hypothetical protein